MGKHKDKNRMRTAEEIVKLTYFSSKTRLQHNFHGQLFFQHSLESHERTDKALTVSIVSRRDFFGFSWESVKICLTVGNQAIIVS